MHRNRHAAPASAPTPARRADPLRRLIGALLLAAAVGGWSLVGVTTAGAAVAHDPADGGAASATPDNGSATPGNGSAEPVTAADRDLLVKVRLAGLWEMPAGRMAAEKGVRSRVREVGSMIGSQHRQLDALVVEAARALGVPLPDEPNADQKRWLAELSEAEGTRFDDVFVSRLRAAHGKVFPIIADVRAGTRNSVVRQLATSANDFVLTHLTLLESTGLVDYGSLPPPPDPPPAAPSGSAAALTGLAGRTASFVTSEPWFGGLLLPIAFLVVAPRLLRRAVRRRMASRTGSARPRPPSRAAGPARGTRVRSAPPGLPSPYPPYPPSGEAPLRRPRLSTRAGR